MYTLISGSPKPNNSNSLYFLNIIKESLDKSVIYELKKDSYAHILDNIKLNEKQEKKNARKRQSLNEIKLQEVNIPEVVEEHVEEACENITSGEYCQALEPQNFILHYEQDDDGKGSDENE